jgi:DNA-binding phage protein
VPRPAYADALIALADQIRDAAMLPPDETVVALAVLMDRSGGDSLDKRLSAARQAAAQAAVARYGSQSEVARRTGLSRQAVSRIVSGVRHR